MLSLRSLKVEGFGPYAEPALLNFPAQGVTVIYGGNMRGETSLMNAIRFAFFGEIHGRGESDAWHPDCLQPRPGRPGHIRLLCRACPSHTTATTSTSSERPSPRSQSPRSTAISDRPSSCDKAEPYSGQRSGRRSSARCSPKASHGSSCSTASYSISTPSCLAKK